MIDVINEFSKNIANLIKNKFENKKIEHSSINNEIKLNNKNVNNNENQNEPKNYELKKNVEKKDLKIFNSEKKI